MSDNLFLFANNNQGTAENLGSYRLYNMKIEGDSEGVESGIDYVDYIYGDRTNDCKLDTGLPFTKSNKYVMGINIIDSNSYSTFTGGFDYNWVTNRLQYGGLNVYPTWTNDGEGYFKNSWTTVGNEIVFDNGVLLLNGVSASNVNTPFDSDATGNNQIINLRYARLRYFRVYNKNGTLIQELLPCVDNEGISCVYDTVTKKYIHASNGTISHKKKLRDFQPVLDSNGVPCLMDKINKKYYYDKNGKGFKHNGYTRVGYIQSDNNSWIDTGIYANPQYKIELVFEDLTEQTYETFFSVDNVSELRFQREGKKIVINYNGQRNATYQFNTNTKYKLILNKNLVHLNDEIIYTFTEDTSTTNYPTTLKLWKINETYPCDYKLYSFKMWNENNELVFDGIPVLDNEGTPCMYDLVTETFFYNQGDGEFSYGIEEDECPKVNYVEYIGNNGNCYIDTGIGVNSNRYIEIDYILRATPYKTSYAFGTKPNWGHSIYPPYWDYQNNTLKYEFANSAVSTDILASDFNGKRVTLIMKYNSITINGITRENDKTNCSDYSNSPIYLFAVNHSVNNTITYPEEPIIIYSYKMYENNELIQELLPCLDDNNVPCMYDTISGEYFYNQGEGNFAYGKSIGYTPIKYIETNGTQYIDTGVIVNDNTYMDIDYRAIDKLHYIEDGLILRLDAIDNTRYGHNASSTVWEDLSGNGLDFNLTDVTVNDTTMAFNGTSSVGTLQNIELWRNIVNNTEQYTVEVCLKFSDGQSSYNPIISTNLGNVNVSSFVETIQVGQQSVGLLMKNNEYGGQLFFTISCDANDIIYHVNTKLRETLDKGDYIYPPTTDAFWIGARLTGQYYRFTGELCSIRIYNKKLTDEERLYNHSSDVIRYGVVTDVSVINTDRNYLMNDFYIESTYKYKEIDTTVEPNLIANEGATLTLGSTYMSYLSEEELEQATKNGWIIE